MSRDIVTRQIDQEVQTANFFPPLRTRLWARIESERRIGIVRMMWIQKRVQSDRVPSSNIIIGLLVLCIVNV
jgi:hypothetical protein